LKDPSKKGNLKALRATMTALLPSKSGILRSGAEKGVPRGGGGGEIRQQVKKLQCHQNTACTVSSLISRGTNERISTGTFKTCREKKNTLLSRGQLIQANVL